MLGRRLGIRAATGRAIDSRRHTDENYAPNPGEQSSGASADKCDSEHLLTPLQNMGVIVTESAA